MKVDDFYIQNSKDYKPPQYVAKLPPKQPLGGGDVVTIDEVRFLFNLYYMFFQRVKKYFKIIFFAIWKYCYCHYKD